jgi:phosphatidylserine decarboxylase
MSTHHPSIIYWNRKLKREEPEQVYGDSLLRWVYGTRAGQKLADHFLSKAFLSKIYGAYQSSRLSEHKVRPFIQEFKIPMEEYVDQEFESFNDFFIRKFKEGARPFVQNPKSMPAFAEARYFAYERVNLNQTFPVKGVHLSAAGLLGSEEKAKDFEGGPLLLARLCPVDYHRFHFPDSGRVLDSYSISGALHSVNPLALKYKPEIFLTNERQVSILETTHFGKLAYVEVGALCVGKIVQSFKNPAEIRRGEEKGYFLFGGSTVIVVGQPGRWKPDADLLHQTSQGRETLVQLGDQVASAESSF